MCCTPNIFAEIAKFFWINGISEFPLIALVFPVIALFV